MGQTDSVDTSRRMSDIEKKLAALEDQVALLSQQIERLMTQVSPPAAEQEELSGVDSFLWRQEVARQRAISAERRARKTARQSTPK